MTIYAVGDIHGQLGELDRVLKLIESDGGIDAEIVFLGDYVDRGPNSRGVIDRLIAGLDAGRPWTCLKGNHDRMMEWFFEEEPRHDPHLLIGFHWLHERIGGLETLASYGVQPGPQARLNAFQSEAKPHIPESHLDFLRQLKITHEMDDLVFVHAGIRPEVPLGEQTEEDLVWIRQPFHDYTGPHPKLVVHGHTPVETVTHYGNRVNTDTGAGYGNRLVPVVFEGSETFTLSDQGRELLTPLGSPA
ncbi:MAG: metallophosphoesterase family protein [Pseudomonadota bacterium]